MCIFTEKNLGGYESNFNRRSVCIIGLYVAVIFLSHCLKETFNLGSAQ